MTTSLLKDLREKIFDKLERSECIIFKKLIKKLGESPESDEENPDFNVKHKTTSDERGEKNNDGLEDYYDPEKGYDDYNSEDSDEGDNNYKGSTHENLYKLMKVKTTKVANTNKLTQILKRIIEKNKICSGDIYTTNKSIIQNDYTMLNEIVNNDFVYDLNETPASNKNKTITLNYIKFFMEEYRSSSAIKNKENWTDYVIETIANQYITHLRKENSKSEKFQHPKKEIKMLLMQRCTSPEITDDEYKEETGVQCLLVPELIWCNQEARQILRYIDEKIKEKSRVENP
nr:400_t:CDS:2 [Entrophospora candida]